MAGWTLVSTPEISSPPAVTAGSVPAELSVSTADWDDPEVVVLCQEQAVELALRYGSDPTIARRNAALPVDVMLIAREVSGLPIGCGGVRLLAYPEDLTADLNPAQVGEIKRMYIRPSHRGRGASRLLLAELETAAQDQGWTRLQLECGLVQPEALSLYERNGYSRIPSYGQYKESADSVCFAKNLTDRRL